MILRRAVKHVLVLLLASGLLPEPALATPESRSAVLFLLIDPSSETVAMEGARTAVVSDATATHYNPAALPRLQRGSLHYHTRKWLPGLADDLMYTNWSLAYSVADLGTVGLFRTKLDLGEQTRTGERGEVIGTFESFDEAYGVSLGADVPGLLPWGTTSAGVTVKRIRSNLADQGAGIERGKGEATATAVDVSLMARGLFPSLTHIADLVEVPAWLQGRRGDAQLTVDVVHLADGQEVRGSIVEQIPGKTVTVETLNGSRLVLDAQKVTQIDRRVPQPKERSNSGFSRFLHHRVEPGISIAASLHNLGGDIAYIDASQADPLPRNLRLGVAYSPIDTDFLGATVAFDRTCLPGCQ